MTKAIRADEKNGQIEWKFDEGVSQNMIIILRQRKGNKDTDNIIYLSDVKYKGNKKGNFKIVYQQAKGCKKNWWRSAQQR